MTQLYRRGGILLALLALVNIINSITIVPTASAQRPTLPPTWTPTFTPTATDTPTVTPTPTTTPTRSPDDICAGFIVGDDRGSGASYPYNSNFSLLIGTDTEDATMRFFARHRLSETGVGVDEIPPVPLTMLTLPMTALPRPGLYDWTMTLLDGDGEILCEREGYFFAQRPELLTLQAPTATPITVVVTATPETTSTPGTPTPDS
jgi:hypothetical protein